VAACVPNTDDPSIPCNTFRAWTLTTIFVILFSGVNQFFSLRYVGLFRLPGLPISLQYHSMWLTFFLVK
jgi:hypothetical protein